MGDERAFSRRLRLWFGWRNLEHGSGEARVETFAVAEGKLEDAIVGGEDEDVARGVEDCGADLAVSKMLFNTGERFGVERVVDIAGDVVPDMAAV
jgi:hypothetical protein